MFCRSFLMTIVVCRQKKAHIMEVQLNGGSISDKVRNLMKRGFKLSCDDNYGITI